jgi:transcriptional regulator GlxA family with amidase domain
MFENGLIRSGKKVIAFVLYHGLTVLDMVGPLEVLTKLKFTAPEYHYETVVVAEHNEPMETELPVKMMAEKTFQDVPNPFAVIVPGGGIPTIRAMGNQPILDYVISTARTAKVVGSVCTGALVLAAAGLLEGREATTHWAYSSLLEKLGAHYVRKRWVEDGKFITSAGVSAGIDMALHLAAKLTNEKTARQVQLNIEYDPQPPFGGIDWSGVERDNARPQVMQALRKELAHRPDILDKLGLGN